VLPRVVLALLLLGPLKACVAYEYEHEFWLRVDGSGSVSVSGRPELWLAFKGLGPSGDPEATREALRALFRRSGLRVRRVSLTRRDGRPYLSVAADFDDVNRLGGSPAFPDLRIGLRPDGDRLQLEGSWQRPGPLSEVVERDGLMAVRFHLPAKIYAHKNATLGVERGNILSWRQELGRALDGSGLAFGATLDRHSILGSTVSLFAGAIAVALLILGVALLLVLRRGKRGSARTAP
jgi:hypothetical protein